MLCCNLYDHSGCVRLFSFDAEPVCAVDYCDRCGDCLVCDIEDGCNGEDGREHFWVVYARDVAEFLGSHELPEEVADRIRVLVKEADGE